jgi:hypothetical protein
MVELPEKVPENVEWQLTTTTIWCRDVKRRVALIVKDDWTSYCCWHMEYSDGGSIEGPDQCMGKECSHVIAYRDRLIQEEIDV